MFEGCFSGKKFFVTGGSRGIGAACVKLLFRGGASVGFSYRSSGREAKELMDGLEGDVYGYKVDVLDEKGMEEAMEDFSSAGSGGIHGLVVNHGIYERRSFDSMGKEEWDRTLGTNLDGAFVAVKKAIPYMERGSIVMISSQLAFKGSGYGADYAASKAGILGLARSLARELAPRIRVNTIAPGFVDTDILAGDTEEKRNKRIEEVPLKRIGAPEEVAEVVAFLLSDSSSYITGANIDVNGGLYIH